MSESRLEGNMLKLIKSVESPEQRVVQEQVDVFERKQRLRVVAWNVAGLVAVGTIFIIISIIIATHFWR